MLIVNICLVILFATLLLVAVTIFIVCSFTFLQPSGNKIFSLCCRLLTEVVPLFPLGFYYLKTCIEILLLVHVFMDHINTLWVISVCYTHINWRVIITLRHVIVPHTERRFLLSVIQVMFSSMEPQALRATEAPPTDVAAVWSLSCVQPVVVLQA